MKEGWMIHWARRAGTRDFYPGFASLVCPVQNMFSSPYTISIYVAPFAQQPGQAVVQGRLSLIMYLREEK
jgi:hypothetical protein